MATSAGAPHRIELNLPEVASLFNTMDASPFRAKDLDGGAEEFIVSWANEFPLREPISLRVHLETWPAADPTSLISDAVHNYFRYRGEVADLEFKRLMRQGRISLAIGVIFLAICFSAASLLIPKEGAIGPYLSESLTIAGWVAMWRPMEIYLYDWWPVRRRARNFFRLSEMPVVVTRTALA